MKRLKTLIAVLIAALCLCALLSPSVAAASIDLNKPSVLTITYKDSEKSFEGLQIKTYRIADVSPDGKYTLSKEFKDYPVKLYDIESQTEWKKIAATLTGYIIADNIPATASQKTDENGTVKFDGILPGMYLTTAVSYLNGTELTVFENFLAAVPNVQNNAYNYNVQAFPKYEKQEYIEEVFEYKVIIQWKDPGYQSSRPKSVEVDIYKNGILFTTETLSPENNWTYKWEYKDDGSEWQAVQKDIGKVYTVTVDDNKKDNSIVITNARDGEDKNVPQTGDTKVLWPYVLMLCLSGSVMIIIAIWRKRTSQ